MNYKHTQTGYLMIFTLIAVVLFFGWVLKVDGFNTYTIAVMFLVLFILSSFSSLKVMIDEKKIHVKFGYGIFKKSFLLNEIISARVVKNHWYCGWGIRVWFWPYMWIYNVSGFDAVEIKMKTGGIFRIGTDVPKELEQAIVLAIKS